MDPQKLQRGRGELWRLARRQHGVVTRGQLLGHGLGPDAIKHRLAKGRLHRLWRGVYAVGRPEIDQQGRWMAAVLSCGPTALLSHRSAAVLWGIMRSRAAPDDIDVVVPEGVFRCRRGIRLHRRSGLDPEHRREVAGIPVTDPISTLVDLSSCVPQGLLERAINEADRLDLVDPETLRVAIDLQPPRPGVALLRKVLSSETLTDTGLERRFLTLARAAGLPKPETQVRVNSFRVDFYWPDLGLVVETDGWRYHRTPAEQATDRRRDQVHTAAGLTTLRFPEAQIRYEPHVVTRTLAAVADRLRDEAGQHPGSIAAFGGL
jgi:very-short-patch-repair endonuclease